MHSLSEYDQSSVEAFASLKLTPREAEVLFWISHGKSNHDIGVILGAKTATIRKHIEHIFGKLSVENRTAAAVMALETLRTVASAPSKRIQPWTAVASLVTAQLSQLWFGSCEIYGEITALIA
jgi:DNA-binding CsgD family transcriptional regulator